MPSIQSRLVNMDEIEPDRFAQPPVAPVVSDSLDTSSAHLADTTIRLMSPTLGNIVPMRGIPPVEYSSDCDLYNFYPNHSHLDRIWSYTYQALANRT